MPRKKVHTRTIVVDVYDEGDGTLTFEGRLTDTQPLESGYFKQKRRSTDQRQPGVLHDMSAKLRIDQNTSEIIETGGQFPGSPYDRCALVLDWLPKMNGVKITSGYTREQKQRLGGPNGCAHMNTLLQVMANTRGASTAYFLPKAARHAMIRKHLAMAEPYNHPAVNSCHMWAAGGPILTAIKDGQDPRDFIM